MDEKLHPIIVLNHPRLNSFRRVTNICIGNLTIIGSDNGVAPRQCQAIIWTNAEMLLIRPLETSFNVILIGNQTFSLTKMHLKMPPANVCRPQCAYRDMRETNILQVFIEWQH